MARSFTVPFTARVPMSPPGKNSGFTTKESVVKASLQPFTSTIAWSSNRFSTGFWKAGRKISRSISPLILPPLPWPSSTESRAGIGTGQVETNIEFRVLRHHRPPGPAATIWRRYW